ncbi:hypothetical protein EV421DRAFT_1733428 [Armillaria borealis]|uniref:Uncharacterized protein n=1 Tax=Armillaria borealis TaxID=47425 RepID=A0AA39JRP6_9AGAR|nr:hypothetical protein EV421DRAFT_1733428 [Armillaria borealis]
MSSSSFRVSLSAGFDSRWMQFSSSIAPTYPQKVLVSSINVGDGPQMWSRNIQHFLCLFCTLLPVPMANDGEDENPYSMLLGKAARVGHPRNSSTGSLGPTECLASSGGLTLHLQAQPDPVEALPSKGNDQDRTSAVMLEMPPVFVFGPSNVTSSSASAPKPLTSQSSLHIPDEVRATLSSRTKSRPIFLADESEDDDDEKEGAEETETRRGVKRTANAEPNGGRAHKTRLHAQPEFGAQEAAAHIQQLAEQLNSTRHERDHQRGILTDTQARIEVASDHANRELQTKVNILYGIQLPLVLNDMQSHELEEAQRAREDWERQARELAGQLQQITEEKDENVRERHQYEIQTKAEIERSQGLVKEAERAHDNLNSLNSQLERRLHENEEDSQHRHREEEDQRKAEEVALLLSEAEKKNEDCARQLAEALRDSEHWKAQAGELGQTVNDRLQDIQRLSNEGPGAFTRSICAFAGANITQAARETNSLQEHISSLGRQNEELQTQLKEANEQQEEVDEARVQQMLNEKSNQLIEEQVAQKTEARKKELNIEATKEREMVQLKMDKQVNLRFDELDQKFNEEISKRKEEQDADYNARFQELDTIYHKEVNAKMEELDKQARLYETRKSELETLVLEKQKELDDKYDQKVQAAASKKFKEEGKVMLQTQFETKVSTEVDRRVKSKRQELVKENEAKFREAVDRETSAVEKEWQERYEEARKLVADRFERLKNRVKAAEAEVQACKSRNQVLTAENASLKKRLEKQPEVINNLHHKTIFTDSPLDDFTFGWSSREEDKDDEESHQRDDMADDELGLDSSDEEHETKAPKWKKKKRNYQRSTGEFLNRREPKFRDPDSNEVKAAIQDKFKELLSIRTDKDIADVLREGKYTTQDVADAYSNGEGPGPVLEPFRPCWSVLKHEWNIALREMFLQHFITKYEDLSGDETLIRDHFMQRLIMLKRNIPVSMNGDHVHNLASSRRTERRCRKFKGRKTFCASQKTERGVAGEVFRLCWRMLDLLGAEGQSSEESSNSDPGYTTVVHKEWRAPEVVKLLKWLDRYRVKQTGYGERKPGPRPHRSLRLPSGQVPTTLRRPIANLPENFYDKVWFAGLLPHQRIELNASDAVELPLYVFTWPTNASLLVDPDDHDEY